jgi:hypothetical protein
MITRQQMLPILVDACPSFAQKWEDHKVDYYDEVDFLPYIALGEFAAHMIDLQVDSYTTEFENIFEVIERLYTEGEHYVKEAATVGLLEGIQNIAANRGLDPDIFFKYLKPVSAKWWKSLNKFWHREIEYAGQDI